jgi:hypothetical protein
MPFRASKSISIRTSKIKHLVAGYSRFIYNNCAFNEDTYGLKRVNPKNKNFIINKFNEFIYLNLPKNNNNLNVLPIKFLNSGGRFFLNANSMLLCGFRKSQSNFFLKFNRLYSKYTILISILRKKYFLTSLIKFYTTFSSYSGSNQSDISLNENAITHYLNSLSQLLKGCTDSSNKVCYSYIISFL